MKKIIIGSIIGGFVSGMFGAAISVVIMNKKNKETNNRIDNIQNEIANEIISNMSNDLRKEEMIKQVVDDTKQKVVKDVNEAVNNCAKTKFDEMNKEFKKTTSTIESKIDKVEKKIRTVEDVESKKLEVIKMIIICVGSLAMCGLNKLPDKSSNKPLLSIDI